MRVSTAMVIVDTLIQKEQIMTATDVRQHIAASANSGQAMIIKGSTFSAFIDALLETNESFGFLEEMKVRGNNWELHFQEISS